MASNTKKYCTIAVNPISIKAANMLAADSRRKIIDEVELVLLAELDRRGIELH
jgi:hypothetical protein